MAERSAGVIVLAVLSWMWRLGSVSLRMFGCGTVDTKTLQDRRYKLRSWEVWYCSIVRLCRIFSGVVAVCIFVRCCFEAAGWVFVLASDSTVTLLFVYLDQT